MRSTISLSLFVIVFTLGLLKPEKSKAFAILAHEAIVDAEWEINLKPMLLARYPNTTPAQLKDAHAYAYGGCLMPDMGYMPFGDPYFTNLLHYVRSGDFVSELLNDAQNINQYAFALGALSHYMADKYGHSLATNKTVPRLYPDLRKKFGNTVTYADDHTSHSRTEFAYDVLQTAQGHYASIAYHDFIGFKMDSTLLAQALLKVYGEKLTDMFPNYANTLSTFRWGVREMMPALVDKAWHFKRKDIQAKDSTVTRSKFKYRMSRKAFNKEFGGNYLRPKFLARVVAFLIEILPKVGPLKTLKFKDPGPEGEKLFNASIDSILYHYSAEIKIASNQKVHLANIDFDTGKPTSLHEYKLTDDAYEEWLESLRKQKFANADDSIKMNIAKYYGKADTTGLATFVPPASVKVK